MFICALIGKFWIILFEVSVFSEKHSILIFFVLIKKEEKDKKLEKENADKEKANLELQKKEREAGKKVICIAVSTKGDRCKKKIERGSKYCTIHDKVEQSEGGKKSQCKKVKQDYKRCKMKTSNKSGYCYYHD